MAPILEFITLTRVYGPQTESRFDMFSSMSVSGSPNNGFSTGQALQAIQQVALKTLPAGYGFRVFRDQPGGRKRGIPDHLHICALPGLLYTFLLSAQDESYLLPFAVLLSLPIGLTGVFVFSKLFGLDNNIYVQISVIMLIGLLSKNAILIVQFALERRRAGMGLLESAVEGGKARLRPILMTSLAFVFGLLPLALASGVGSNGDKSIGTGAIGGMLFGITIGVFAIPSLYIIFQGLQEKVKANKPKYEDDEK